MPDLWNETAIQQLIDNRVEEGATLEYKSADALGDSPGKKKEIAKDVSAMANSAGGLLIYGIAEYQQDDKKHLPERITPISRQSYSKEWLDQVISSNILPRIKGVVIHPVPLSSSPEDVVYVVEIPQSTTAHQVTASKDCRYYMRYNFESVPMDDYQVRDVIHRATVPDVDIQLGLLAFSDTERDTHVKALQVKVRNEGVKVVIYYKVDLMLRNIAGDIDEDGEYLDDLERFGSSETANISTRFLPEGNGKLTVSINYLSQDVLFPNDEVDISERIGWGYIAMREPEDQEDIYDRQMNEEEWRQFASVRNWLIEWTIYADDMPRKMGAVRAADLPFLSWRVQ